MSSRLLLERPGNVIFATPWPPALEETLRYWRTGMDHTGRGRPKYRRTLESLYKKKEDGSKGCFPAGLLPRALRRLRELGVPWDFKDYRDVKALQPRPDFSKVAKLREGQPKVLLKILTSDRGVVVCNTGFGKSFLIRQICLCYPGLKIIVTSPGRDDVRAMHQELSALYPAGEVAMVGAGKSGDPDTRIVVTTTKSLPKTDLIGCDLLLFDEAHTCGHNQVAGFLAHVQKARMFGFTASPTGRCDSAEMVMEAIFGPELCRWNYGESVDAGTATPIEVWLYDVPGDSSERVTPVAKKRWNYWRNTPRNAAIAEVARGFDDDDQTLILVETIEHGAALKALLPDYEFVYANMSSSDFAAYREDGINLGEAPLKPSDRDKLRDDFRNKVIIKAIATTVWKQAVDFPQLNALINAGGSASGIHAIQIPGRLSRISDGKEKAVLVDFADTFNDWTRKRAGKRLGVYRKQGWIIIRKEIP